MTPHTIAIHGAPRSGTSWLGQIFNSSERVAYRYQPFFSHAFRDRVNAHSDATQLQGFFADMFTSRDEFLLQVGNRALAPNSPQFEKGKATHLVYKEVRFHDMLPHLLSTLPGVRAIGIVRDPRAVLASWARAPREFDRHWSLQSEWRDAALKNAGKAENWYGFERWKGLATLFLRLKRDYARQFYLLRYEDLLASPRNIVADLFAFSDLRISEQTLEFLDESTSRNDGEPYGVYRDRRTPGPPMLSADIARQIESELEGTALARFLARELV